MDVATERPRRRRTRQRRPKRADISPAFVVPRSPSGFPAELADIEQYLSEHVFGGFMAGVMP